MNKGDIILVGKNSFLVYDKYTAITADLFGITIIPIEDIIKSSNAIIIHPKNIIWTKRKKINDFFAKLISGKIKLSFKEKLNFFNYIIWLYQTKFNITLIDDQYAWTHGSLIASEHVEVIKCIGGQNEYSGKQEN